MTAYCADTPDARLDPWMTAMSDGDTVLFGYCLWHPALGGRSWCRSSPLIELNERELLARTLSGHLYSLGKKIGVSTLPDEEARLAHFFLAGPADQGSNFSWNADKLWLSAQKVCRWTGLPAPPRGQAKELASYLLQTRAAYRNALHAAARTRP